MTEIKLDERLFRALMHYNLRTCGTITPESFENIVAQSTGSEWVGKSRDLADCVNRTTGTIISIKTAVKKPSILKTKESRDFTTDPDKFDINNMRQVGRRCGLSDKINDQEDEPKAIGIAAWENFKANEQESLEKYQCSETLDISIIHGVSCNGLEYIARISFYNHHIQDVENLDWKANMFGDQSKYKGRANVTGYRDGVPVMGKNGARGGHEQNCFFRYYKLDEANWTVDIRCPIPERVPFTLDNEEKEMMLSWLKINQTQG
jgi:hypothetical protein